MRITIRNLLLLIFIMFPIALHAKVIDLDTLDPDHCRKQILSSQDEFPVILSYFHDCGWAQKFMPVYEAVANEHPERTFFRFDYESEWSQRTFAICMEQLGGSFSPQMRILALEKDPETGMVVRTPPLKMGGDGRWTKDEVVKFIDISESKKYLSLSHEEHKKNH